jgi:hypothetical protein
MARTFPELGPIDDAGMQGMFIGDLHNEPRHLTQVLERWGQISKQIDVLFLEHFFADRVPDLSTRNAIQAHLFTITGVTDWKYQDNPWWPQQFHTVGVLARASGTIVRGVESDRPTNMYDFNASRFSFELNHKWMKDIRRQLFAVGKRRYAVFGGRNHAVLLQHFMRQLVCYTLDDNDNFREYIGTSYNGRYVTWAP